MGDCGKTSMPVRSDRPTHRGQRYADQLAEVPLILAEATGKTLTFVGGIVNEDAILKLYVCENDMQRIDLAGRFRHNWN